MAISSDYSNRPVPGLPPTVSTSTDTPPATTPAGLGTVSSPLPTGHVPMGALSQMVGHAGDAGTHTPENPAPSRSELQSAYDSIDWDKPSMGALMKAIAMFSSAMRKAQNESKWALQASEMQNLRNEVANMRKAATTEMVTTIATSVASIGFSAVNFGASTRALKQTNSIAGDLKKIDLNDANSQKVLKGLDADLNLVSLKSTRIQTGTQIGEGVTRAGGAIGTAQAGYINADAKEDAAEAQRDAAYKQAAQSAEDATREEIRAARDMLLEIIRTVAATENKINSNF
jgi:hypothetical protein